MKLHKVKGSGSFKDKKTLDEKNTGNVNKIQWKLNTYASNVN